MVRKSERTKAKGTPEKTVEKSSRKTGRYSRRRRKSSSESEHDVSTAETRESGDEVQDTAEAIVDSVEKKTEPESVSGSGRSKRVTRRQAAENELTQSTEKEWKEDELFWASEGDAVGTSEAKPKEDEGTLWKVQSANGSSGEIQKLKICRQRPADASESSPSSAKESPRRKRSSHPAQEEVTSDNEPVPSSIETEIPSSTVPDQSEPVPADSTDTSQIPEPSGDPTETVKEVESSETLEKENLPSQSDDQTPTEDEKVVGSAKDDEEKKEISDIPNSTEDLEGETVERSPNSTSEKDVPDSSTRRKKNKPSSSDSSSDSDSTSGGEGRKRKSSQSSEASEKKESSPIEPKSTKTDEEEKSLDKEPTSKIDDSDKTQEESKEAESSTKLEIELPEETKKLETEEPKPSTEEQKEEKEPVVKKVRERIKFPENKLEAKDSVADGNDKEPVKEESTKEEGELSPTHKEPRPHSKILIINKPQEHHSTKPTILKRTIEETVPVQRKRRLTGEKKNKQSDEASLTISSQSLKLLVPDAKPLPLEEVDLSYEGRGEVEEEEEEEEEEEGIIREPEEEVVQQTMEEPKARKVEIKARDMEIRVKNDVREVTKKDHPRADRKDKPKEPAATDNHKGQTILDKVQRKEKISVKVNANDSKFTRKISIVSDDAKKLTRSPSPASRKPTAVLFITNLVRPFTAPQLRELLARTGTIAPNGFYIDKIKSKCYVKYAEVDMAIETRHALHGVRWPVNNPKTLKVEFATSEDMTVVQQLAEDETKKSDSVESGWLNEQTALKPSRRVTAGVREWDVGKVTANENIPPPIREEHPERKRGVDEEWSGRNKERGTETENRRRERPHSPEHKEYPARKVKRRDNDAPSKLLDDLFRKTKTTPCIYWLPLTASQIVVKEEMRRQHMAEHERRLAEIKKSEQSRRDRERERRKK